MRRMSRLVWVLVIAAAAAMVVQGCSSREDVLPAPDPQVVAATQAAADRAAKEQRDREYREREDREQNVREQRELRLRDLRERVTGQKQTTSWVDEMKLGAGVYVTVRTQGQRFWDAARAIHALDGSTNDAWAMDYGPVTWEDAHVDPVPVKKQFRHDGIAYAKTLLSLLSRPIAERDASGYGGEGEGSWSFADGVEVVEEVTNVLNELHVEPAVIGTTPQALRVALLDDLRDLVACRRSLIAAGGASETDGGWVSFTLSNAMREYHFTWDELGLNPAERELVR